VNASKQSGPGLRRDLGTLESYAILIGILIGAGIFRVTSDATAATGPSVILAHLVLAPIVLASSVAYLVFLSTPLGLLPGGEILHIENTLGSRRLTFLSAWLKLISYLGAGAYLADALAVNLLELFAPGWEHGGGAGRLLALGSLLLFFAVHVVGVRWVGRLQLAMCLILAVSLATLIVPGLFAIEPANYRPFFTHGAAGFGSALPPLFFAYAGFEALSQAAGEVRDSRTRLPRVFVFGILVTTAIFVAMSVVAFGVLPASVLGTTGVPMSRAAATYLPFGATALVTLGAVMAVATSLNATMLVPARLAWLMACEGHMPAAFAQLHVTARTPVFGLSVSFVIMAALLLSGRMGLALGISVVALMLLYALHSVALILLPRRNPALYHQVTIRIPRWLQLAAAWISVLALAILVALNFEGDLRHMLTTSFVSRLREFDLTSLELLVAWVALGLLLFRWSGQRPNT
jgi:amino acid transporter